MFTRRATFAAILTASAAGLPRLPGAQADEPQQAVWLAVRRGLQKSGYEYFESHVKDCEFPRLKGKVAAAAVGETRSRITLVMSDADKPEVTLIVHHADAKIQTKPAPGAEIEFIGVAREFTVSPFMLTFEATAGNVTGLALKRSDRR